MGVERKLNATASSFAPSEHVAAEQPLNTQASVIDGLIALRMPNSDLTARIRHDHRQGCGPTAVPAGACLSLMKTMRATPSESC